MPIKVYAQRPDGTARRVYSSPLLGNDVAGGGPQVPGESRYDWMFAGTAAAMLHGTSWGLVTNRSGIPGPDGLGLPTGIAWLPPERMDVQDDEMVPEDPRRARIYYNGRLMDHSELVKLKAFSVPGRTAGISPIMAFATLIAQGLEALDYSHSWFTGGGFPTGTFQNINEEIDEQQARQIRTRLTDTIRLHMPLVFGRDWEFKALSVPPNEAIFIQGMQLNATQIAAIYGVNPVRVGGTRAEGLSYSNVTQDQLEELQSTLHPWLTRWENFLTSLLPSTQYVKFDTDALLRMDPHTRNTVYQIQRNIGTLTANEAREFDDRPSLGAIGDDPLPLPVLERMASTTRTIPKTIVPLIDFEADHIAQTIEELETEHPELVNPQSVGNPPLQLTPETYLCRLMTQVRSAGGVTPAFPLPEQPTAHHMIIAHRIDNMNNTLQHAKQRAAEASKVCGDNTLRRYHLGHVIRALDDAKSECNDLSRALPGEYDGEAKELAAVQKGATLRGKALNGQQKMATFAHLLDSVAHNIAHSQRHAESASGDRSAAEAGFDMEHLHTHLDASLEHAVKLAKHVRDNYPAEWKYLAKLQDDRLPGAARSAGMRVGDRERNLARRMLADHGAAGRLRQAEADMRSAAAGEAVTLGDLAKLFADLPVIEMAASRAPEEDRSQEPPLLFGPAAMALLHGRAMNDEAALAATNGKGH